MHRAMKRFSAPASVYPDPSRPPDNDDSDASLSDTSKKVKTAQSFEALFNNESLSDIVLDINHGEVLFHAHKMIVGLKSERLAALITSMATAPAENSSKPVLHLLEEPECGAVFSRFLYFIYSGAVWLHRDYVVPLFKLSVKYGVNALANHCENYVVQLLHKCLSVDTNCANPPPTLSLAVVGDLYEDDMYREETRRTAFAILARRFAELIRTERWIGCTWLTVRDLLRSDECLCEENLILVAATDWMKKNKLQDKVRIQEILASIRYPRLPRRVLYHLHTTASFKNFPQVQELIEAAIRYHCFKDVPEAQDEFPGLQYRARGKGKSRHTVCGGENLARGENLTNGECQVSSAQHTNWSFGGWEEAGPDAHSTGHYCDNVAEPHTSSNEEQHCRQQTLVCRNHVGHAARHRLVPRLCGTTDSLVTTFHPTSSPVAAVQPRVQCQQSSVCDREAVSSSPDISLQINIHSHSQV